ncbi:MAG TPA: hypothetical protein VG367_06445 [Mucilaginibacter sp.]|jgi:hypothetical protein|nr:hypothetical protein [Mucilaginibacter sp.]
MKITSLLLLFFLPFGHHEDLNSTVLLQKMYNRYHGKWHSTRSFDQTTERYRNDSLVKSQTWYEHILYPDKLRIDFDSLKSGSGVIYRGDSTYVFRNHKLLRSAKGENELIFFLGGMYFMPFDQVLAHFKDLNYDLTKFHTDTWKGKPVYVIGAEKADDKVNQLWIDQEKLVAIRFIKYENNIKEEGTMEDQVPVKGGGWSETLCKFYINDHVLQVEKYHDVAGGGAIDKSMFEPSVVK